MSKEDDEKWWNLVIYKMYVTNEERDVILPWMRCQVSIDNAVERRDWKIALAAFVWRWPTQVSSSQIKKEQP